MAVHAICCSSYFAQYLPAVIWDAHWTKDSQVRVQVPPNQCSRSSVQFSSDSNGSGPPNLAGRDPAQTELQGYYPPKCHGLTHDTTQRTQSINAQKRAHCRTCLTICGIIAAKKLYSLLKPWKSVVEYIQGGAHFSRQRVHDPDLGLERTLGNGYETDQKQILKVHEPFTDFPASVGRSVHRISLGFSHERQ